MFTTWKYRKKWLSFKLYYTCFRSSCLWFLYLSSLFLFIFSIVYAFPFFVSSNTPIGGVRESLSWHSSFSAFFVFCFSFVSLLLRFLHTNAVLAFSATVRGWENPSWLLLLSFLYLTLFVFLHTNTWLVQQREGVGSFPCTLKLPWPLISFIFLVLYLVFSFFVFTYQYRVSLHSNSVEEVRGESFLCTLQLSLKLIQVVQHDKGVLITQDPLCHCLLHWFLFPGRCWSWHAVVLGVGV